MRGSALAPQTRNRLQSVLLLAAMTLLWALLGWSLAGPELMFILLGVGLITLLVAMPTSPRWVLALYRARPLPVAAAPQLHALVGELAGRAGLRQTPALYLVPSRMLNAFSVGSAGDAAVALTDGLLRTLSWRELAGVLAHELSHVRHNDMWVMALADLVSRMTHLLSLMGQLLLLLNLPLILLTDVQIPWLAVLLLIVAPSLSALLQLALSRQREYDADLGAVRLTGDPEGLARALVHLEGLHGSWLYQVLLPGRRVPDPSLLRSHPPTEERVRRLMALAPSPTDAGWGSVASGPADGLPEGQVTRPPRWRPFGTWF